MKRIVRGLLATVALLLLMQVIRFERTNPPTTGLVHAPADVEKVLRRACFDCHSNETAWPWYTGVAPASWLVHRDVVEGRRHLNFSAWGQLPAEKRAKKQKEVGEEVRDGEMPPWFYLPLHPDAKLSDADRALLEAWAAGAASD